MASHGVFEEPNLATDSALDIVEAYFTCSSVMIVVRKFLIYLSAVCLKLLCWFSVREFLYIGKYLLPILFPL